MAASMQRRVSETIGGTLQNGLCLKDNAKLVSFAKKGGTENLVIAFA